MRFASKRPERPQATPVSSCAAILVRGMEALRAICSSSIVPLPGESHSSGSRYSKADAIALRSVDDVAFYDAWIGRTRLHAQLKMEGIALPGKGHSCGSCGANQSPLLHATIKHSL